MPSRVLNALWTLRFGRLGARPLGLRNTLKAMVSGKISLPPRQPLDPRIYPDRLKNLHDQFQDSGFEPRALSDWLDSEGFRPARKGLRKLGGLDLTPETGITRDALPQEPQEPQHPYITPEWLHQTAHVLQTNPEAARKWFLGSVAGLARKKGLKYHIVAQDPLSDEMVEGGELTLDQAVELLRRRKSQEAMPGAKRAGMSHAMSLLDDLAMAVARVIKKRHDEQVPPLEGTKTEDKDASKTGSWVAEKVQDAHATKHGPEMGLEPGEYEELGRLLSRLKRKRAVNRRHVGPRETVGYDIPGLRLVLTRDGQVVSLYQKAAALKTLGIGVPGYMLGGDFWSRLQEPEDAQDRAPLDPEDPLGSPEDFQDASDLPMVPRLSSEQLEALRDLLNNVQSKRASDDPLVYGVARAPQEPKDCEYRTVSQDNQVVGYIRLQPWGNGWFLSNYWVNKNLRNKGIGTRLLREVVGELGAAPLYLKVEPFDEGMGLEALVRFYEKFGFVMGRENLMRRPKN